MNPFLKHLDNLISLLEKNKINYEIVNANSLAPSIEFKREFVNFKVQMELRDCLDCIIYRNNEIQEIISISNTTKTEIGNYFKEVLK